MDTNLQPTIDWDAQYYKVAEVFKPNTPIDSKELFSGRINQLRRIIDVINQKGQHVMIYGERGVGKTSLANVFSSFVPGDTHNLISARINGDRADDFDSLWRKVFNELKLAHKKSIGFNKEANKTLIASDFFGAEVINPDSVRQALVLISDDCLPILIIDEFDRVDDDVRKLFADLIKNLSDHALSATIILVGVGDSVDQLITEHESVSRALVQVQMPRMTADELKAIVLNGLKTLGMEALPIVVDEIVLLSQGLPHYAHLLSLMACRDAIENKFLKVDRGNLNSAIHKSLADAQQSIRTKYHDAIRSAHKDNLFTEVLLACALAEKDDLGTFAAYDVKVPLAKITEKEYDIPSFARHLTEFCENKRGHIFKRSGIKRRYRYKFADPLMQPYVIMQGVTKNKIESRMLHTK